MAVTAHTYTKLSESMAKKLNQNGRVYVNMPVNSPALDHIYLLQEPEQVVQLVESSGLKVDEFSFFPMTGYSIERARKIKATVSCVVVATLPN